MPQSLLHSLVDTSGNAYLFGKAEHPQQSIFLTLDSPVVAKPSLHYVQIYNGHELQQVHQQALARNNTLPVWFFPFLLVVLAVIAWLKFFYSRYFQQIFQAFLNFNLANQIVRDENIFVQRASIYLSVVFNLIIALLLYLLSLHYEWKLGGIDNGFMRFFFLFVLITIVYALKFIVLKVAGWLFEQEREMTAYMFHIFLTNNLLGIALLPIIGLLAYSAFPYLWLAITVLSLVIMSFGWRIFRGIQIGLSVSSFSPLYLFLYLCTLEIAPLLVLIRIVIP